MDLFSSLTGQGARSSRQSNQNSPANSQLTVPQRPQMVRMYKCRLLQYKFKKLIHWLVIDFTVKPSCAKVKRLMCFKASVRFSFLKAFSSFSTGLPTDISHQCSHPSIYPRPWYHVASSPIRTCPSTLKSRGRENVSSSAASTEAGVQSDRYRVVLVCGRDWSNVCARRQLSSLRFPPRQL